MKSKKSSPAKRNQKAAAPAKSNVLTAESLEVKPDQLGWRCPDDCLKFDTTDDLPGTAGIIGQPRAVDALNMALEIESVGYNVFVSGPVGTGRTTTVKNLLETTRERPRELDDKCFVNNFRDPDQPRLLRLRAGYGRELRRDMDELVDFLVKNVPVLLESDTYQQRRSELVDGFKERGGARVREFEKRIIADGFALVQTGPLARPELAPIVEKQPVSIDTVAGLVEEGKLTPERADEIKKRYQELSTELSVIFKEVRDLEKQARDALAELDQSFVRPVVEERLADIEDRCGRPKDAEGKEMNCPDPTPLHEYIHEVRDAVLARPDDFRQKPPAEGEAPVPIDPFLEFRVNVVVDNSETKTAPVIFETNPNYKNLFGSIERVWDRTGMWRADFTKIKAGSLLCADHGFLVVNALDALVEPGVWPALKRTLRNRQLEITGGDPYSALFGAVGMKPEPVAIDLKVIMIGDPQVYSLLAGADEDFKKVFKVRADFDWVMDLDKDAVGGYLKVIKALCEKEKLRPFDRSGARAVIEHGARLAGRTDKLSTRFNIVSEVLTEADHWAGKAGAKAIGFEHVQEAINRRRDRVRLVEVKLQEAIREGTVFIDVTGKKTGQVNGLAVYDTGEYAFGIPTRITAKTGVGSAGIINIEREAQLSGPTHDKGVYILTGYLRQKFARRQPLVLSASICFEQSYGGIDGDSASSTEVYALLSDLSGLPIRQDLAVTGSVNQQGEVQPIGGVNWKIEGFFEACMVRGSSKSEARKPNEAEPERTSTDSADLGLRNSDFNRHSDFGHRNSPGGLTGTQGVIVPKANLPNLMLRPEVVKAVKDGKFHIYSVSTIDEGIELLTGVPAGAPDERGNYPPDTVNGRVMKRLCELIQLHQDFKPDKVVEKEKEKKAPKPERKLPRRERR